MTEFDREIKKTIAKNLNEKELKTFDQLNKDYKKTADETRLERGMVQLEPKKQFYAVGPVIDVSSGFDTGASKDTKPSS